jgi:solute carrier family 25 (mitochondrial S-adenosylmethionine transporter), member 26
MVGLSDKSFRILCRRYGAQVCHTEMADPGGFARSEYYRTHILGMELKGECGQVKDSSDRPLVLQFGSSNVPKLLEAIRVAVQSEKVDAIELNCGCPQQCARKGNYGSYLLDPPNQNTLLFIIESIRNSKELPPHMPLLVKMRVLESIEETVDLAKRIVNAGAGILTVHGRTRHQGGGSKTSGKDHERLASWPHIRAVKQAVNVPVIANGNVPYRASLSEILEATGCNGVMSGVGILRNPSLFDTISTSEEDDKDEDIAWNEAVHMAIEYLDLAMVYHTHPTRVSRHLLWMLDGKGFKLRAPLAREQALRLRMARSSTIETGRRCTSTVNGHIHQRQIKSNRQLSSSRLVQCLGISIFILFHHFSSCDVHAYANQSKRMLHQRHQKSTSDIKPMYNDGQRRLEEMDNDGQRPLVTGNGVTRQSALAIFHSATMSSLLASNIPSMANAQPEKSNMSIESEAQFGDKSASRQLVSLTPLSSAPVPSATATLSSNSLQEGISGFVAGAALSTTKTLVKFPLDTVTVRLQQVNRTQFSSQKNALDLFQDCYNGITVTLICNIPAGAVFFAVKDSIKGALKRSDVLFPLWLSTCLAVAVSQIPYWLVRNPSEVIKVRQQAHVYDRTLTSTSALGIIQQVLQDQKAGVQDLYTGYWENVLYAFPADVLKFVVYEMLTQGDSNLSPLQGAEAGALATAIAQLVTTPLDVVRNRLMMKAPHSKDTSVRQKLPKGSYLDNLIQLGQEEGLDGLFAGAMPRVAKACLSGAIQFATYEETKQSILKILTGQS